MQGNPDLRTPDDDGLSKLPDDLEEMRRHLDRQVRRMDGIVDHIQAGWQGTTGSAYRDLHRGAAQDAVRIRETLGVMQEVMTRSWPSGFGIREIPPRELGFTESQKLALLPPSRMRKKPKNSLRTTSTREPRKFRRGCQGLPLSETKRLLSAPLRTAASPGTRSASSQYQAWQEQGSSTKGLRLGPWRHTRPRPSFDTIRA